MILALDRYEKNGHNLGPESRNFSAVWFHGCGRGCPGCIAAGWNSRPPKYEYEAEFFADMLLNGNAGMEGIVISGGEPFRQAAGVSRLLAALDERTPVPMLAMAYTGYTLEELRARGDADTPAVLRRLDILVDGPYVAGLDDDRPYRGSSNQRLIFLTDRCSPADFTAEARYTRVEADMTEIAFSGIPGSDTKKIWQAVRSAAQC